MNYLIKWQFTKDNSIPFKTQVDIINSNLIPLAEDKSFQEKKLSFYMTKVYLTNVRLAVFVEEKNLEEIKNIVERYTKSLKLNPVDENGKKENDWDGIARPINFTFSKDSTNCDENFYKYLEDITWIGIDLHKKDLTLAVLVAVRARYETEPLGKLKPRLVLESHFYETSGQYQKKDKEGLDRFWGNCGFTYKAGNTLGDHFYYNIVLGIEPLNLLPCQRLLGEMLNILRGYNMETDFPTNLQCWESIAFLINKALKN